MTQPKTYYASEVRSNEEELQSDILLIEEHGYLKDIFLGMPEVALVLDKNRQIVYANEGLLSILPERDYKDVIGMRPGEAIKCIHSKNTEGGCGTSEACRYCGAVNAILQSKQLNEKVEMECRIVSFIEEEEVSFDFRITAKPIKVKGTSFTLVFMHDISNEKRKMALERIFFHDIMNTAGGIRGFTEFLKQVDNPETVQEYIKIVDQLSHDLVDEIHAQRALVMAENEDLKIVYNDLDALKVLEDVRNTVSYHVVAENKEIVISNQTGGHIFSGDPTIVKRVLINMLKNALEATEGKGQVLAGYYSEDGAITYYVHNDMFMPKEVQLQVFKRSFSTKGTDRGLGTYSIKLLTEKYLKGKVWFETDKEKGTSFFASFPG